ncbi:helix-turn-helix domain-containing protein [Myxococcus sp. CA040A]|uniref:ArsR/SmtB family transcription factor n=1 Tax=Myxococcus sp. CA040A TaxID=2741738 RepID=UPI00157B9C2A|nr:helix-turn-helix domain-containing protein [Myxococcus sp. CA040A]NTX08593.1 helix-turn-helix transcriptional regulator [Myxococcus sp. CA040A]
MAPRRSSIRTPLRTLETLTSPARQELIEALTEGEATVRVLSERLGRSRQALYHHLGLLERAGVVRIAREQDGERHYAVRAEALRMRARRATRVEVETEVRAAQSMLRLTGREVEAALRDSRLRRAAPQRELVAVRAKARLSPAALRELNQHLEGIRDVLTRAGASSPRGKAYAVTLVLTPAREAGRSHSS